MYFWKGGAILVVKERPIRNKKKFMNHATS